jgi:hypothetical protein
LNSGENLLTVNNSVNGNACLLTKSVTAVNRGIGTNKRSVNDNIWEIEGGNDDLMPDSKMAQYQEQL